MQERDRGQVLGGEGGFNSKGRWDHGAGVVPLLGGGRPGEDWIGAEMGGRGTGPRDSPLWHCFLFSARWEERQEAWRRGLQSQESLEMEMVANRHSDI